MVHGRSRSGSRHRVCLRPALLHRSARHTTRSRGHGVANTGKVSGSRCTTRQRLTVTDFHHVAQPTADTALASGVKGIEADGHTGVHTAVDVLRGQFDIDVVLSDDLRLVFGAGGDDPVSVTLIAKRDAAGAYTVAVVDDGIQIRRDDTAPQRPRADLRCRLNSGTEICDSGGVGLGN